MEPQAHKLPGLGLLPPTGQGGQAMDAAAQVQQAQASAPGQPPSIQAQPIDEKTDMLDQEWAAKVKAIIEKTKYDPYMQSQELSKAKVDYLRIRFNKHIKVNEDTPR